MAAIDRSVAGRLGVAVLDVSTSRRLLYRADERFPMCSTFKWLLAAQVLSRVNEEAEALDRLVRYGPGDLLEYAPVTRGHLPEGGLTVAALAAAAVQALDNTAGILLLQGVGGPASLTAFLRSVGDRTSRLDRTEPELNSAESGDVRDTTTPSAMVANLERILLGRRLQNESRARLIDWLVGSTRGANRLRAGPAAAWRIGNKAGTGAHGATNDVAIAWPPGRPLVLPAAYLADSAAPLAMREAALAEVARGAASWLART